MDEDLKWNHSSGLGAYGPLTACSWATGFILCLSFVCLTQDFIKSLSDLNLPLSQLAESDFSLGACYFRLDAPPNVNIPLLLSDGMHPVFFFTETHVHLANSCWDMQPFDIGGLVFTVQSFGTCCVSLSRLIGTILCSEFTATLPHQLTTSVNV